MVLQRFRILSLCSWAKDFKKGMAGWMNSIPSPEAAGAPEAGMDWSPEGATTVSVLSPETTRALTELRSRLSTEQLREAVQRLQPPNRVLMVKPSVKACLKQACLKRPEPEFGDETLHISLCSGMGADFHILKLIGAIENGSITQSIGVENDEVKRAICNNLHPPETCPLGGVDHTWFNDIMAIKREDIVKLKRRGRVKRVDLQPPCKDHSTKRLLPSKYGKQLKDPRPGFRGRHGQVALKGLEILGWIIDIHGSEVEYFMEFLDCSDMKSDWSLVCEALGEPIVLDAADVSTNRRNRVYWTNIQCPTDRAKLTEGFSPIDANTCMDTGRSCEPYKVCGKTTIRTIGGSWIGDPSACRAAR